MRSIKANFCGETDVGHSNPQSANQKQSGQMVAGEDVHGVISPTGLQNNYLKKLPLLYQDQGEKKYI